MKDKVRQDSNSQLEAAVTREDQKLSELKAKIVNHFAAPEFDKNKFAAELIAAGKDFTEIVTAVNEGRKQWEKDHPAPACNIDLVKQYIARYRNSEFTAVTGCNIADVDGRLYNDNGTVIGTVDSDTTVNGIVSAVFSYRFFVAQQKKLTAIKAERKNVYHTALYNFIAAGKKLGLTVDEITRDVESDYNWVTSDVSKTAGKLQNNINRIWAAINESEFEILTAGNAKREKLISKRQRMYKDIETLTGLLS